MPDADNAGPNPPPAPTEIIVFDEPVAGPPGVPVISIPGVIVIEGNIKSLKEFYTVRLLLMNTSGIFTLKNVLSDISFPDEGLTSIAPADGIIAFGDILPGNGGLPGQAERQFIIRGDSIGVRRVRVGFGGTVAGPGIPEENPVPFNGSAFTKVEVKGPPTFLVKAIHPDSVEVNVPYEFRVDITNTGDIPALYTSLELSVGADGKLVKCDDATPPNCTDLGETETRSFGDILPGKTVSALFTINPKRTGPITSCVGVSDQNITLQVTVGVKGCLVGQFPPEQGVPDGTPTVSVVPTPNTLGVSIDTPVTAFFSQKIEPATLTTGAGGTFNIYDRTNNIVPGTIRQEILGGKTVAIWQVSDGITNRLAPNVEYTIVLTTGIANLTGAQLYNKWTSRFTTTGEALEDFTPPTLTLSVEPPANPSYVLPGQLVKVNTYAADQGSGVVRVELRIKDMTTAGGSYQLIDRKVVFSGDLPPYLFTIDSAKLIPGNAYQLMATAYDFMMNAQNATLGLFIAASAEPPTILLPDSPAEGIPQGISVSITPESVTGGVTEVRYYLDEAGEPFKTVNIPPYQAGLGTLTLEKKIHAIRAVAIDALGQIGEDTYEFEIVANPNKPQISLNNSVGASYIVGSTFVVNGTATDSVGIQSITFALDGTTIASGNQPFYIATGSLSLGTHTLTAEAINILGAKSTLTATFAVVPLPNGPAPQSPSLSPVPAPTNGIVTISGSSVAGARINVTNATQGFGISVNADGSGSFSASIAAAVGDLIQAIAYDYATSQLPSSAAEATVPAPPVLLGISASPSAMNLTDDNPWQDITVFADYDNGSKPGITSLATYASSNAAVASVNSAGRVIALKNGSAVITASYGGKTAQVDVTVDLVTLVSISVEPPSLSFAVMEVTQQLTVTAHYSNGSSKVLQNGVSFIPGDSKVATVSATGLVNPVANGSTLVVVYVSGAAPVSIPVTVNTASDTAPQVQILSPASGVSVQRGELVSISIRATDEVGGVTRIFLRVLDPAGKTIPTEDHAIQPAALDVTRTVTFTVPINAVLGGSIAVTAGAEDTGGKLASPVTINLPVADKTAPTVSIKAPANQAAYNYGHVVRLRVTAEDAVGVAKVRYEVTGAFTLSGTQDIMPAQPSTDTSFNITIPNGVGANATIQAFAADEANNERASAPVDIVITGADVTSSETFISAIADPGSSSSAVVTFEVAAGLEDLDHVELYFRRNGIGTFNRYTDSDNGNPEGRFFPASGSTGMILFDSTKMGGDGAFEFYTVGVDTTGNREAAPENADAEQAFLVHTVVAEFSTPMTIGDGDTTFDNKNILVRGTTLTVNGHHSFHNIELLNGAVLTHSATTMSVETGIDMDAWTLSVDASSKISVDGMGYRGGSRDGNDCTGQAHVNGVGNADGAPYRSGGSYGGSGGVYEGTGSNSSYGLPSAPIYLGAGGSCGGNNSGGGNGGGRILIRAINIAMDGNLTAHGGTGNGYQAGSGSGGSIFLTTASLSGSGALGANGGAYEVGGGGGRIAVYYHDISTYGISHIQTFGGTGNYRTGGSGSIFLKRSSQTHGDMIVDSENQGSPNETRIPAGDVYENIILRNNARAIADVPVLAGNVTVESNSVLTMNSTLQLSGALKLQTGGSLTHSVNAADGLKVQARRIEVASGAFVDVTAKGYWGGHTAGNGPCAGMMLNGSAGSAYRSAGSYGGWGGVYDGTGSNAPYGHPSAPAYPGSGGSCGGNNAAGGNGGGRITLVATDAMIVDGSILANGGTGNGYQAGSGSGGSIHMTTASLSGSGVIRANGGAYEVGGGGGRIAVYYNDISAFDVSHIQSLGGIGNFRSGGNGSIYLKSSSQIHGDLVIDGAAQSTPNETTAIPEGDVYDNILVRNNARAIANVPVQAGNMTLESGGVLSLNNSMQLSGTLTVRTGGAITHSVNVAAGLTVHARRIEVESGASIDATAKGYPGGYASGNGACFGMTLNGAAGAAYRSGGSYGGYGGVYDGAGSNAPYGHPFEPMYLGAGGSCGGNNYAGGNGGGRITLVATEAMIINGSILANGGTASGFQGGSGSGGSIHLATGSLSGSGGIHANGGAYEVGGGGGRIAVYYQDISSFDVSHIQSLGGIGNHRTGGNGSLFFKSAAQTYGDLVVDGAAQATPGDTTLIPGGDDYDTIIIRNNARVLAKDSIAAGNVTIESNGVFSSNSILQLSGTLRVRTGGVLTHSANNSSGLSVNARKIHVESGGSIDATGKGYPGGYASGNGAIYGLTLNGVEGSLYRAGGSYGGWGGVYDGLGSNVPYGHPANPVHLGSGGSAGGNNRAGGNGGGRITLVATEALIVDGSILANGGTGNDYQGGSGSGGSIYLSTDLLSGTGAIRADGGAYEVGGGGGRIAVYYGSIGEANNNLNNLHNLAALGGHGNYRWGGDGTVFMKRSDQTLGDLFIEGGIVSGASSNYAVLSRIGFGKITSLSGDTIQTDESVAFLPGGLVGLELNPNIAQSATYRILSNTKSSITVDITGKPALTEIAQLGNTYAGVYHFDNVYLRGGGKLILGDQMVVSNRLDIDEYGKLSHYNATMDSESKLDLKVGVLDISSSGSIDADGLGYLGGYRGGNDCSGQTLGNADGSTYRAAGSYGGMGGIYLSGGTNAIYGTDTNPIYLGSGGSCGGNNAAGGNGGGLVLIQANDVFVDGYISADGGTGNGYQAGSGSGGSVHITTSTLSGTGTIRANGGAYEVGAGGGRIYVHCTGSMTLPGGNISVGGGAGIYRNGTSGTLYIY
jgi:hypothetical protein